MSSGNLLVDFLFKDVTLWGQVQTPMLSWLCSWGIILFFLWHVARLLLNVRACQLSFMRISSLPEELTCRPESGGDSFKIPGRALDGSQEAGEVVRPKNLVDEEDLNELAAALHDDPMFRQSWLEYRQALMAERVPWFVEPRIYTGRSAEEFFTHEALIGARMNLAFYHHLPALITGIGLLLTFLALFIGLSKLHAEGHSVTGIQGLINGLAGKFLTSIVALICANVFVLIEKPLVRRLELSHRRFLELMGVVFPRRTMEHILEDINSRQSEEWMMLKHPSTDLANRFRKSLTDSLSSPLADLNATIRAFTQGVQGNSHNAKLMEAVQTLTVGLRDAQMTQERACMNFEHLVGTVSDLLAYQQTRSAQGMVKLWPRPYPNWKETEVNNKAPESTPVLMRTAVSKP